MRGLRNPPAPTKNAQRMKVRWAFCFARPQQKPVDVIHTSRFPFTPSDFLFPLKIEEEADIQHDAHSGRSGRGQTDHGQAGVGLDAHDVSHRQADEADRKLKEKELKALLARDEELDGLFERIYEDNVSGKISDERFSKMSRRYEDEQKELTEKIKCRHPMCR